MKLNNKGFSTIEILVIIVMSSIFLLGGIFIAYMAISAANENTFKSDAKEYLNIARNSYLTLKNSSADSNICITLNGLKENDYLKSIKDNYNGFIIVSEDTSTISLTNKKLTINNINMDKIDTISIKNGDILKGNVLDDIPSNCITGSLE